MRRRIEPESKEKTLSEIMIENNSSYQKIATDVGVSRQCARQIVQRPITCMKVNTLAKIAEVLGYHLELVPDTATSYTNAERLRSLSDEELAGWFKNDFTPYMIGDDWGLKIPNVGENEYQEIDYSYEGLLAWLKKEAKSNE